MSIPSGQLQQVLASDYANAGNAAAVSFCPYCGQTTYKHGATCPLLAAALVAQTPAYVQSATFDSQAAGSTSVAVMPNPQTPGNLNLVAFSWFDATTTVSSVTDSAGNTNVPLFPNPIRSASASIALYACFNLVIPAPLPGLPSFINAVTVTLSSTPSYRPMGVVEYSGLQQTPAAVDVTNSATGSGTTASCAVTTLNANDLVVAFATGNTGALGAAGQTSRTTRAPDGSGIEDITLTSAGLQTMKWALGSGNWLMAAVAFKAGRFSQQFPGAILHS